MTVSIYKEEIAAEFSRGANLVKTLSKPYKLKKSTDLIQPVSISNANPYIEKCSLLE